MPTITVRTCPICSVALTYGTLVGHLTDVHGGLESACKQLGVPVDKAYTAKRLCKTEKVFVKNPPGTWDLHF